MVYLSAVCAAAALGLGWVLQHRIACRVEMVGMFSVRMLIELIRSRLWWAGIAVMAIGQTLAGLALQLGPVTVVGPLLSANLLFAYLIRAVIDRERVRAPEAIGAVVLCVAIAVFLAVADPHASSRTAGRWQSVGVAAGLIVVVVGAVVLVGSRRGVVVASILAATGAGVLYGLADVSTRAALVLTGHRGVTALVDSPWPYLLLVSAAVGVVLSQSAFRASRLDYSLPPITLAEPIVAGALGVALLGDRLSRSDASLVIEFLSIVAMFGGVVLIGRSPAMASTEG